MLKFYINNDELEFDGSIRYRMLNPVFNDKASHSFSVRTVNTPHNKDIIRQSHLSEKKNNEHIFDARLVTDAFFFSGIISIESVTEHYIDFNFIAQSGFWTRAKETSVRNCDIPFNPVYAPVYSMNYFDDFPYVFPYGRIINAKSESGGFYPYTTDIPFLSMKCIHDGILDHFDINKRYSCIDNHYDLNQLYLFNSNTNSKIFFQEDPLWKNKIFAIYSDEEKYKLMSDEPHNLAEGDYLKCFGIFMLDPSNMTKLLSNKFLEIEIIDEYSFYLNDIEVLVMTYPHWDRIMFSRMLIKRSALISEKSANHLPEINAAEFLTEFEKLLGFRVFIDESLKQSETRFLKDILNSTNIQDITNISGRTNERKILSKSGYHFAFGLSQCDRYKSRIQEINEFHTIKSPVSTFNNLPASGNSVNDLRLVTDEKSYYRYYEVGLLGMDKGWEFYSEDNLQLNSLSKELSIETKFYPLLNFHIPAFIDPYGAKRYLQSIYRLAWHNDRTYAIHEKKGSFLCMSEIINDDMGLFFYRGLVDNYPLTTSDIYDHKGVKISSANLALKWDGQYGIVNNFYNEYLNLMANYCEETWFINWPQYMLGSFPWHQKFRIGHMNYLVNSIDLEIFPDHIEMLDSIMVPV